MKFEDEGNALTMNCQSYRAKLKHSLVSQLEDIACEVWFQLDDATCHTARETFIVLLPSLLLIVR